MSRDKLVIVSTRLPVSVSKEDGVLVFKESSGGLATGVSSATKGKVSLWIGWPGISSDLLTARDKKKITAELKKRNCQPVFLNDSDIENYYSGYCNATLWPLFHYFSSMARYEDKYWESYVRVNSLFYRELKKVLSSNTRVWVHDYQLMLLPKLIRDKHPDALIGFFLHVPFPSYEIFRLLPERKELLKGLLGADLIGFHTYDYVRHFRSSISQALGLGNKLGHIRYHDRNVKVDAFPIGIDYKKFAKAAKNRNIKKFVWPFGITKTDNRIILAVDRADYSKGIPARLNAFELFLKQNPKYHAKVQLILVAVPSREDVKAYQNLRQTIEQKISRINGEFSTVGWTPISYRYQSLPFNEFSALYAKADVMLVTPLRDGMNLVAKEYVATHHKSDGVLILSEMAGAASELVEAIQVNPNNIQSVANAVMQALEMSSKEQKDRMKAMQKRISTYTVTKWAEDYINELELTHIIPKHTVKNLDNKTTKKLNQDYTSAKNRLILLDYDGTLKSFVASPSKSLSAPSSKVRRVIKSMTDDPKNRVVIVSGRPKSTLESFFKNKGLGLVAEHGGWVFDAGSWAKHSLTPQKWKKPVRQILERYNARTPGAIVEEKDFALVWHYRNVLPDLAYVRKEELKMDLRRQLNNDEIGVFDGSKIIEIKPKNMHKGAIISELLSQNKWDFIIAIGDDYTDEDMFRALPERSYTIKVGDDDTEARYRLRNTEEVIKLLTNLKSS